MFVLRFSIQSEYLELLDDALEELGCDNYSAFENLILGFSDNRLDDSGFPITNFFMIEVFCQLKDDISKNINILQNKFHEKIQDIKIDELRKEDWVESYIKELRPIICGSFYVYNESMRDITIAENLIPIKINSALAFGSGHHQTTQACILNLLKLSMTEPPKEILDMGCGTGILGICALKMWKESRLIGIDIDPDATKISNENYRLNEVNGNAITSSSVPHQYFDLIMCNILKQPLINFHHDFAIATKTEGHIIISGFIMSQEEEIMDHYRSVGFSVVNTIYQDEWVSILLTKKT
ncbi:MAG: 50S ribosomal protein L11 methyltransferase [Holosporales bacterium]|nr:50S ribosomal protein L11 methyltransferase [Holosporales bacterium]